LFVGVCVSSVTFNEFIQLLTPVRFSYTQKAGILFLGEEKLTTCTIFAD